MFAIIKRATSVDGQEYKDISINTNLISCIRMYEEKFGIWITPRDPVGQVPNFLIERKHMPLGDLASVAFDIGDQEENNN